MPSKPIDLTGKRYGQLTVISFYKIENKNALWRCLCDCGNYTYPYACSLKSGLSRSCGCMRLEKVRSKKNYGLHKTTEYVIWHHMKNRCNNKNASQYKNYGARGIKVCDEWNKSFFAFLKDMGYRPSKKHSIDRIDNNKGYEPSNCRWATQKEQCNNTRRALLIHYNGKTQNLTQWCTELNLNYAKIYSRIAVYKWDVSRALSC